MNRLYRLLSLQWLLAVCSYVQATGFTTQQYHLNYQAFLWDESCTDWANPNAKFAALGETKQDAVATAFEGALELAADAWSRLNSSALSLNDSKPANVDANSQGTGPAWLTQEHLDAIDPAYAQFFKFNWEAQNLDFMAKIWRTMNTGINAQPGTGGRPKNAYVKLLCQSVHIPFSTGVDECTMGNNIITRNENNAAGTYQGTYMNFCDGFFSQPRFDVRKAAALTNATVMLESDTFPDGEPSINQDWEAARRLLPGPNKDGNTPTDAGSVVHDWTHFNWIGPTNSPATWVNDQSITSDVPEVFGFVNSMNLCCSAGTYTQPPYVYNAANYGWYAEYGYWASRIGEIWPYVGPYKKKVQVGEVTCST